MVISLTTTPMMCAYILKDEKHAKHGRLYKASESTFDWMLSLYRRSLSWVIENPGTTMMVLFMTVVLNFILIAKIPKGFFPTQDTGVVFGGIQGPQDASFPVMNASTLALVNVIKNDPATNHIVAFTGGQGATNGGFMFMSLKPLDQRDVTASGFLDRVRPKMNRLPVASAFLQAAQDIRIGGRNSNALYQYTIQSDTTRDLYTWGPDSAA